MCLHAQLVDRVIQSCPIDTRRDLYGNIVLSVSPLASHRSASYLVNDVGMSPHLSCTRPGSHATFGCVYV